MNTDKLHDGVTHYFDLNYLDIEKDLLQKLKERVRDSLVQVLIDSKQNMDDIGAKLKEYSWQITNKIDSLNFNEDTIDSETSQVFKRELKMNVLDIFDKSIKQATDLNMISKLLNVRNLKSKLAAAVVASGTAELLASVRHERVKVLQQRLEKSLEETHILNNTFSNADYDRFQKFIKRLEEKLPVKEKVDQDDQYYEIETIDLSKPEPFQTDIQNHVKQLFSTVDMAKLFNRRMHGPPLENDEEVKAQSKADNEIVLSIKNDGEDSTNISLNVNKDGEISETNTGDEIEEDTIHPNTGEDNEDSNR